MFLEIQGFNECIKARANLSNPYFWKGQCLLYQREFEACIVTLNKAIKLVPGNRAFEDMKKIATICKSIKLLEIFFSQLNIIFNIF